MYIKIYNFILRVIDLAKFNNFIFLKLIIYLIKI
jgi:hypothetical protein